MKNIIFLIILLSLVSCDFINNKGTEKEISKVTDSLQIKDSVIPKKPTEPKPRYTGIVNKSEGLTIRKEPSLESDSIGKLADGSILEFYGVVYG